MRKEDIIIMDFTSTLILAQCDDLEAKEAIVNMYNPLIIKRSMILNQYDEDLYQNLI